MADNPSILRAGVKRQSAAPNMSAMGVAPAVPPKNGIPGANPKLKSQMEHPVAAATVRL